MIKPIRFVLFVLCTLISALVSVPAPASEKPEVFVQLGHATTLNKVAFSIDGKYLISAGDDRKAIIWDIETEREFRTLKGHAGPVYAAVFSPDGGHAVTCSDDTIFVWNIATGQLVKRLEGHTSRILSLAFTPDGRYLVSGGLDKNVRIWDIASGKPVHVLSGHRDAIFALAVSHDGRYAASGGWDKAIILWDIAAGKAVQRISPFDSVHEVTFSSDGKYVVAHNIKSVETWSVESGKEICRVNSPGKDFSFIALSPDGLHALGKDENDRFSLWNIRTGGQEKSYEIFKYAGRPAAISPDGSRAAIRGDNFSFITWDLKTGKKGGTLTGYADSVFAVKYHADTGKALSGTFHNVVRLWDIKKGRSITAFKREITDFPGDVSFANAASFSPDGRVAAVADGGYNVLLYDVAGKRETGMLKGHKAYVSSVAFSNDGRFILTGDSKGIVKYRHALRGEEIASFRGHRHGIFDIAFTPDGKRALTGEGGFDVGLMKLWDLSSGREIAAFRQEDMGGIYSIDISRDGKYALTGSGDGMVRLWNMSAGKPVRTFKGHDRSVFAVSFSNDGTRVLSGGRDQKVILWDVKNGTPVRIFRGHMDNIISVDFLSDGRSVVSGSENGVTRYWNMVTGEQYAMRAGLPQGEWVIITPEGFFDASPGGARFLTVRVGRHLYGIDQFYARFYRPELVALALAGITAPAGETVADVAKREPAPTVIIESPHDGFKTNEDSATLNVKIIDNGGGIGDVMVRANGTQISNDTRGIAVRAKKGVAERELSFTVALVEGDNKIEVTASNKRGSMESAPVGVSLFSSKPPRKPELHALVVGINEYRNKSISLKFSVSDAEAFAETLKTTASPLFEKVSVTVLSTFEETTKEKIFAAFDAVSRTVKPEDVFVFYNASHGAIDIVEGMEQYYLLTSNILLLSSRHLGKDALSQDDLKNLIGGVPAQKKLIILDTCHAGRAAKELTAALLTQTRGLTESTAVKLLQRSIGSSVFSASSGTQQALEGYRGHGLFTYILVEGMKGKADLNSDGFVKINELADYVEEQVITISEDVFKRQQVPTNQIGANFPIGRTAP